jgi:isochorismate synthase
VSAEQLGAAFDLLAAWQPGGVFIEHDGLGVATGPGSPVALADAVDALRARDDGALACGALPFAGGGFLSVSPSAVRRVDPFATARIGPTTSPVLVSGAVPSAAFSEAQLTYEPSPTIYEAAVQEAARRISAGELRKVVLARTIEVDADRSLDPRRLAHRLRAVDRDAYTFIAPTDRGVLVGASPELLVSKHGTEICAHPLAGSAPRSGDPAQDRDNAEALTRSAKDQQEHQIVVEAVAGVLQPLCDMLDWDHEPSLHETPNVWHLSTRFRGRLREPVPTVLELVTALHPTPAVAGTPTDDALAALHQLEAFDRGFYAGPVGWVDANGDGEWAIALRCAELVGEHATLYAGAGIVGDSDPASERAETDRKFRAFLDALRWG